MPLHSTVQQHLQGRAVIKAAARVTLQAGTQALFSTKPSLEIVIASYKDMDSTSLPHKHRAAGARHDLQDTNNTAAEGLLQKKCYDSHCRTCCRSIFESKP